MTHRLHPVIAHLYRLRRDSKLSLPAAGERAGVGHRTIQTWEQGRNQPGLDLLAAYADSYGYRIVLVPKRPEVTR